MVISRRYQGDNDLEMYQNVKLTCRAYRVLFLFIKPIVRFYLLCGVLVAVAVLSLLPIMVALTPHANSPAEVGHFQN